MDGTARRNGGFTLIELLVVLFIVTTVSFVTFPSLWSELVSGGDVSIASRMKALREEAIGTKRPTTMTVNFKDRFFLFKGARGEKRIAMKDGEIWELFVPSSGSSTEGEATVLFPPAVNDEFVALIVARADGERTITLNNLSGEATVEDGRKKFDE